MSEKKLSIQSSIAWNSMGSIFYLGCQWLITMLVVRLADVETAGVLSLAMSTTNLWYAVAIYGMRNFQVSDTTGQYGTGTYVYSRIITCIIAILGCMVNAFIIPYDEVQRASIIIYMVYKLSEAMYDVYAGVYQREWRLDYAGKSMVIRGILTLFSFVGFLVLTDNIVIALSGMAVSCGLAIMFYDIPIAKKLTGYKINKQWIPLGALLKECFPLVVYTMLSTAIGTIPRLIMERVLGGYELGIYGSVATPTLIIQMGATYIFNPFVTVFAERYNNKEKKAFWDAFRKCLLAVVAVALIGLIGGAIFGEWGLNLLYGAEVAKHVELLLPLILCVVLTAFAWFMCGVLTAIREFNGLVVSNVVAVLVSGALSLIFESRLGMQGASLALAVATLVEIIILVIYMLKKMKKHFEEEEL